MCTGVLDNAIILWHSDGMITVDDKDLKQLESDLKTFAIRAYPFATKATLNRSAFDAQKRVRALIRNKMITRNKFTMKSIQVEQAKTLRVSDQEAVVGSIASYMEDQEFGGTKTKGGKVGVAIATTSASGEGRGVQPRRRLPRRPNKKSAIKLSKNRFRVKSKKQEIFLRVRQAAKTGRKFIFLDLQKHPGIYRVAGGKRKPKINLVHDMSRKSVRIPARPTFAPATRSTEKQMPRFYKEAVTFQLKRHNLFKG